MLYKNIAKAILSENNFKHCKLANCACKNSCTEKNHVNQISMLSIQ